MIILHTAFEKDDLFIWGEMSFGEIRVIDRFIPNSASGTVLKKTLRLLGVRASASKKFAAELTAEIMLPHRGGIPVPSDTILGTPEYEEDSYDAIRTDSVSLAPFYVNAVQISFEEFVRLVRIVRDAGDRLPVPGCIFGDDLKFMCRALEYTAVLVERGCFVPDMQEADGEYFSFWRPVILAKYQEEFAAFIAAMPEVLTSFSVHGTCALAAKQKAGSALLSLMTDSLIRMTYKESTSQHTALGHRVSGGNAHEIWLRSLNWSKAPLTKWKLEMQALYPQVKSWSHTLDTATAQPWRLLLRIAAPIDEEGGEWSISWHLQSVQDRGLVISADSVWHPDSMERTYFERTHSNPRLIMLRALGRLAMQIPFIASALNGSSPIECTITNEQLFEFIEKYLPLLIDEGIQVQFPSSWDAASGRTHIALNMKVAEKASGFTVSSGLSLDELLKVEWSVVLGDETLTDEEFAMLTQLKTPLVSLHGKWFIISHDEIQRIMQSLKKLPQKLTRRDALASSLKGEFDDLLVNSVDGSEWITRVKALLCGRESIGEEHEPEGFCGTLRPYQAHGLAWLLCMAHLGLGACLADDMGLGKTVQTLAMIKHLQSEGEKRPVLLICPTSVIENWRCEALKFVPDMKTAVHYGTKRNKKTFAQKTALPETFVISSYSLLHRDMAEFSQIEWAGVILDEAQNIKNPDTNAARAARSLKAEWHIALTGTPIENHAGDMWSIMEFLVPGLLPSRARFTRDIVRPIQAGERSAMERVRRMTAPFILRRMKTDKNIINDLPDKIETQEYCTLTKEQATLYSAVTQNVAAILNDEGISRRGRIFAVIAALKQVCDHPALYLKDKSDLENRSGKLDRFTALAEELVASGERALIFTQYAEMGKLLKKYLEDTFGKEVLFLHGGTPRDKRIEMVNRFQSDNGPAMFVLSIKAGGTGLNLTRASHVIMFDRWWNPAVEQQAVDRAYRIGQKSNVHVHYFCCRGTIEEKIERIINSKKEMAQLSVSAGEEWVTEMDEAALRELFTLEDEAVEK